MFVDSIVLPPSAELQLALSGLLLLIPVHFFLKGHGDVRSLLAETLEVEEPYVLSDKKPPVNKKPPFEKELLRKLVSKLSNITEVRRILLFGSRARGFSIEHWA